MSPNHKTSAPVSSGKRRARQLKIIGVIVLAAGMISAGIVYWFGTRNANLSDDISMLGFNRAEQQQMGELYGRSGLLIDDLLDDLKQPDTQAILILVFSALAAVVCFYFARLLAEDDEPAA
jgi:hypothetical protein